MDTFLETYNFLKLNQEEAVNELVTTTAIAAVIKKLLTHKIPGPDAFTGKFYHTFKEELTLILFKLFQKIQEEGRFLNSYYETSINQYNS